MSIRTSRNAAISIPPEKMAQIKLLLDRVNVSEACRRVGNINPLRILQAIKKEHGRSVVYLDLIAVYLEAKKMVAEEEEIINQI